MQEKRKYKSWLILKKEFWSQRKITKWLRYQRKLRSLHCWISKMNMMMRLWKRWVSHIRVLVSRIWKDLMMSTWERVTLKTMRSLTISNKRCTSLDLKLLKIYCKIKMLKMTIITRKKSQRMKCISRLLRSQKHIKCWDNNNMSKTSI